LKHRFLDFTQVAFGPGQEENEFPLPGDYLKHCLLDLNKFEFWAYQEAEDDLSAIRPLETSFYLLEKSHIFDL